MTTPCRRPDRPARLFGSDRRPLRTVRHGRHPARGHDPARPDRRRPHRLHRPRPRAGADLPGRRAGLRVHVLARPVPPRRQRLDAASTSTCTPARSWSSCTSSAAAGRRSSRCSSTPRRTRTPTSRATATSVATTSRSTSTTSTPRSRFLHEQGLTVLGDPTASKGPSEGQRWIYFLSPWGMQFELGQLPRGQGVRPAAGRRVARGVGAVTAPRVVTRADGASTTGASTTGAASERIAAHLRDGDPRRRHRTRASGSGRRRSPSGSGTSRLPVREALRILEAEGLTEHTAQQGRRGSRGSTRPSSTCSTRCASAWSRWR